MPPTNPTDPTNLTEVRPTRRGPENWITVGASWQREHALAACQRLADNGVWAKPNATINGEYTGLIVVDPDQLFDLLNDLDLRALEA